MQSRVSIAQSPQRTESFSVRFVISSDRFIYRFARHWLRWTNLLFGAYLAAILIAPILSATGHAGTAKPIYRFFGLFCHQQDARSFHIAGHPLACCERCAAVYASLAISGILFALMRNRVRRIRYAELVALCSPLVIDGMAVGAHLYGGNALIRVITGGLFGLGLIWLLFPWMDGGFVSIRSKLEIMFERLVTQGRANPLPL
jgi:uncharacterized membrane protein